MPFNATAGSSSCTTKRPFMPPEWRRHAHEGNLSRHASIRSGCSSLTSPCYWKGSKWPSSSFPLAAAGLVVIGAGTLAQAPLQRIPENTLKFIVGIMLTTFGTFWSGESFGINWPFSDLFLLLLAALYLAASLLLIWAIRQRQQRVAPATTASQAKMLSKEGGSSMNAILKVILAVYNFFVGDLVILIGITLTMGILALIHFVDVLAPLRGASGIILIVGVLATLVATLGREVARSRDPRTCRMRNMSDLSISDAQCSNLVACQGEMIVELNWTAIEVA